MSKFLINDLINKFSVEVLSGKKHLNREIPVYGLNRPGLELTGFVSPNDDKKHKRAILMSSKESAYMLQFDDKHAIQKYNDLLEMGAPLIIINQKFKDERLIKIAKKHDFPLIRINHPSTSEMTQKILDLYDNYFAPTVEVHATLLNIFGKGVLVFGESGIGKSEVSLELMKKNHLFVGDDRIILTNRNSQLYGRPHPMLQNLLEVRGIGILDISRVEGFQFIMKETKVHMGIELFKFDPKISDTSDRIGNEWATHEFLDIKIPYLRVPVSAGRNLANIIEAAVGHLKVNESDPTFDIIKLLKERTAAD